MKRILSLAVLFFFGTQLSAQDPSTRSAGVWLRGGLAQFTQEITATTSEESKDVITQAGALFNLIKKPSMKFGLGAQISLAKVDLKALTNGTTIEERKTALNAQALDVFARFTSKNGLYAHAGYQLDLGPDELAEIEDANSDLSNAIKVGLGIDKETDLLAIHAAVGTAITLKTDVFANIFDKGLAKRAAIEYNVGDFYVAEASAALKLGKMIQAGVKAQLVNQTDSEITGGLAKTATSLEDGISSIQFVPYLTFKQPGSPFRLSLRGGIPQEYFEQGMLSFTDGDSLLGLVGLLGVGVDL